MPLRVQESLGELVGAAKEGLLASSVGLGVVAALMEEEVVRSFVERTRRSLSALMSRRLEAVRLA